tara:strand:+ start:828 stop:1052 length:225 start_codon:yes stop_codon:yes gene_type:complete
MADKFGPYIQRLMTTVLDKTEDEFVQELAWNELKRIKVNIEEFLNTKIKNNSIETETKKEKILLQEEDKTHGKN